VRCYMNRPWRLVQKQSWDQKQLNLPPWPAMRTPESTTFAARLAGLGLTLPRRPERRYTGNGLAGRSRFFTYRRDFRMLPLDMSEQVLGRGRQRPSLEELSAETGLDLPFLEGLPQIDSTAALRALTEGLTGPVGDSVWYDVQRRLPGLHPPYSIEDVFDIVRGVAILRELHRDSDEFIMGDSARVPGRRRWSVKDQLLIKLVLEHPMDDMADRYQRWNERYPGFAYAKQDTFERALRRAREKLIGGALTITLRPKSDDSSSN
jgi:hypothetical protein